MKNEGAFLVEVDVQYLLRSIDSSTASSVTTLFSHVFISIVNSKLQPIIRCR